MYARGLFGYTFYCVGALSLAFAGGRYAIGEWQRQDARRAWEEWEARAVVALARRDVALDAARGVPIAPGEPVARLLIPRLLLDEIVLEGVDDNSLNAGPGHVPGSAYPGEKGNSVISAHRDRHFARLGDVQVGDTIVTESGARSEHWIVISKRIIDADAPALFHTAHATLTLTTCWPIRYLGTAPERLLITARPATALKRSADAQTPSFAAAGTS
jgi:LPXTG-site transpeptidase (sortase) family protein